MLRSQLLAVCVGLIGLAGPLAADAAEASDRAPAWAGTIEIQRNAHVVVPDGPRKFVTEDSERIVYTLRGDGTESATFEASHHSKTSSALGTSRTDGTSSGVAQLGIEYLDTFQDGSFWHLFIPAVQVRVARQWSRVPGVTMDNLNTQQTVVEMDAPRQARVLSGSFTRPWRGDLYEDAPKVGGTAQATETITVRLHRVARPDPDSDAGDEDGYEDGDEPPPPPPPEPEEAGTGRTLPYPQVTIHGPACACRSGPGKDPQPLRYTATASWSGGTFDTFTVEHGQRAPRVVANEGGEHPHLELLAGAPIDPVNLGIDYHYQGFVYAAEPLVVEWCAADPARRNGDRAALAAELLGAALSRGGEGTERALRERLAEELAGSAAAGAEDAPCSE